jgi:hypothetical protein
MYPSTSLFVCFGRLSIVVLTLCSYPLQVRLIRSKLYGAAVAHYGFQVHPCRAALDKVFSRHSTIDNGSTQNGQWSQSAYHDHTTQDDDDQVPNHGQSPLLARSAPASPPLEEMSSEKLCIITGLILVSTFIIALCVDDLGLILGFVGSVGSTSISFIVSQMSKYSDT